MDKIHGALRESPEDKDDLLHCYYLNGGRLKKQEQQWRTAVACSGNNFSLNQ